MAYSLNFELSLAANSLGGVTALGLRGTLTMSGNNYVADNQNIGTSAEALTFGDLSGADHLMILKNSDTTNFCTLYADSATAAYPFAVLYPGQFCVVFSHHTIGAKADTAGVILQKTMFEQVACPTAGLTRFTPQIPIIGYSKASVSVSGEIEDVLISAAHTFEDAVDAVALLDNVSETDLGNDLWPATQPLGGGRYGTYMACNLSTSHTTSLQASSGGNTFGTLPINSGFCLLAMNRANLYVTASAPHYTTKVITRNTAP